MTAIAEDKEVFLEQLALLEKESSGKGPALLQDPRETAGARFQEMDFPTSRNEDWKFTNPAPLLKTPFVLAAPAGLPKRRHEVPGAIRVFFVNGRFVPELSPTTKLPGGVVAGSLATLAEQERDVVEPCLGTLAGLEGHIFTALNTAFLRDGAVVIIPRGQVLTEPIQIIFVTTANARPAMTHPRTLIVAGINSQATIVESYQSDGESGFTNAVTEIALAENAVVDHYKVQRETPGAFHIANTQVHLGRASNFSSHYVTGGGKLVRNECRVLFDGEGAEATLNGLYLASGSQHVDNFTVIDHAKPHCASHELYKGILNDKAHGVFNGKIFVRQDAQKTDAKQTNQVLLLSEDAIINTKPQLEIFADDVKCTHGATVGQLDAESIFYLRSRGIGLNEARRLLTYAFANDILCRIKIESLEMQLERLLLAQPTIQGLAVPEAL